MLKLSIKIYFHFQIYNYIYQYLFLSERDGSHPSMKTDMLEEPDSQNYQVSRINQHDGSQYKNVLFTQSAKLVH